MRNIPTFRGGNTVIARRLISRWAVTALAATVALALAAPNSASAPGADTENMTILVRSTGQGGLDPVVQTGSSAQKFVEPLYEGLVSYDSVARTYRPELAESWTVSQDGLVYTFKLRRGVEFHDGTRFNAEAVSVNYERTKAVNLGVAYLLEPLDRVEVVDEYTVRLVLKAPVPTFLFTTFRIKIVGPTAIRAHDVRGDRAQEWLKSNAVGTGPFQLVKWTPEQNEIIFKRFPNYRKGWKGKHLDVITYRRVFEPTTQRLMLERADGDFIIDQVQPQDVPALRRNRNLIVDVWSPAQSMFITMRSDRGPLASRKLRQALSYAFPYEEVQRALGGMAKPLIGPLPTALAEHDPTLAAPKQDLQKARELLAEAGYPNGGLTFDLIAIQALALERLPAELFQAAAAQLNIRINIQELTFPVMVVKFRNENEAADMGFLIVDAGGPTPDRILFEVFHSSSRGKVYNWSWYKNELLDRVLSTATQTANEKQRFELYRRAQRIIVGDAPAIFVMETPQLMARRTWVKGFKPDLISPHQLNLYDMYIEGRGR